MSQTFEFYTARADEAAAEATAAKLDNVRDRALRSEAAWRQMADRVRRVEAHRIIADEVREARRETELRDAEIRRQRISGEV
ncbi:hypothetical protein [Novosphingobium lentum]|uniref:hypothetical protein n=1 Tax=Novosphingobium lentum TaxID=145287 RepID=UPI00082D2E7A|nr:hypothetical protein [Novosphingobium lentum]